MRGLFVLVIALDFAGAHAPAMAALDQGSSLPPTPGVISIADEGDKGFAIRHFPTRLRLYTHDGDTAEVSTCVESCAAAWPPVRDMEGSRPIGDWTLVTRHDGAPQWAYQGKPVYLRYHDSPDAPGGDGSDGVWHIVRNIPKRPAPSGH